MRQIRVNAIGEMTDQQELQTLEDQLGVLTRFVALHNDVIRVRPGGSTTRATQRAGAENKKRRDARGSSSGCEWHTPRLRR